MNTKMRLIAIAMGIGISSSALAGVDWSGLVQSMWMNPSDGNLYFRMDAVPAAYCAKGWFSFNMYVPKGDPNFVYYYGMLVAAVSKGKAIYIANVSYGSAGGLCNVGANGTGYGIVLIQ